MLFSCFALFALFLFFFNLLFRRALILEKNRRAEQERYLQELHAAAVANTNSNLNPNTGVVNHISQQQL